MIYKLYYDETEANAAVTSGEKFPKPQQPPVKIVVLGDYMVGKTSFVKNVCNNDKGNFCAEKYENTKKLSRYETELKLRNNEKIKIELIDTPGLEQHNNDISAIFRECQGAIVMYDVTSTYSFVNLPQYLERLRQKLSPQAEILLIGSKTDLTDHRKVTFKQADEFAASKTLSLFEISSKTNINTMSSVQDLLQRIVDRRSIGTFDPSSLIISENIEKSRPSMLSSLFCCWVY